MKKINILITTLLCSGLFASNTVSTTKKDCDNGVKGFYLEVKNETNKQAVVFDSCKEDGLEVVKKEDLKKPLESKAETKTIDGIEYTFINGYTEPTIAADSTCSGGYGEVATGTKICRDMVFELEKGWLNTVESKSILKFNGSSITSLENFANITKLHYMDGAAIKVQNLKGLENVQEVGYVFAVYNSATLTTLDGLNNLKIVKDALRFSSNINLQDISALNSVEYVENGIFLDDREYEVKLAADSYLCQNPSKLRSKPYDGPPLNINNVCEQN